MDEARDAPMTAAKSLANVVDLFHRALAKSWSDYEQCLRQCALGPSVRSVHELRAAARTLEAQLLVGQPALDGGLIRKTRRVVKKRLRALSALRDAQVQRERIYQLTGDGLLTDRFRKHLARRTRRLRRTAIKALSKGRLQRRIPRLLNRLQKVPVDPDTDRRLRAALGRRLDAMARRAMLLQPRSSEDLAGLHSARIAWRKYRLAAAVFLPLLPASIRLKLRSMKRHQKLMGEIHDDDLLLAQVDRSEARGIIGAPDALRLRQDLSRHRAVTVRAYLRSRLQSAQNQRHELQWKRGRRVR